MNQIQIFKVQLSMYNSHGKKMVFIYNKDRTIQHEQEANDEIKILAGGRFKFFMYGYVNHDRKLVLENNAPWQKW